MDSGLVGLHLRSVPPGGGLLSKWGRGRVREAGGQGKVTQVYDQVV